MSEKSIDQNIFPKMLGTARCFLLPEARCLYMDQTQNQKTIVWFWLWDTCPENYRMINSPVPRENNCTKVLQLLKNATKHTECKLHTDQLMTAVVLYIPWQISDYSDWGDWILKKRNFIKVYIKFSIAIFYQNILVYFIVLPLCLHYFHSNLLNNYMMRWRFSV